MWAAVRRHKNEEKAEELFVRQGAPKDNYNYTTDLTSPILFSSFTLFLSCDSHLSPVWANFGSVLSETFISGKPDINALSPSKLIHNKYLDSPDLTF